MNKTILLIDQDGVLSDYYGSFLKIWKYLYPDALAIPKEEIDTFYFEEKYPEVYRDRIFSITRDNRFFERMMPMEGAIETMKLIAEDDRFDSYICTTPDIGVKDQNCFSEKARWIEKHLGNYWVKRTIMTSDKTMVLGDFLIDDKPKINGTYPFPSWEQVVFDHPFNKNAEDHGGLLRMYGWKDWPKVAKLIEKLSETGRF